MSAEHVAVVERFLDPIGSQEQRQFATLSCSQVMPLVDSKSRNEQGMPKLIRLGHGASGVAYLCAVAGHEGLEGRVCVMKLLQLGPNRDAGQTPGDAAVAELRALEEGSADTRELSLPILGAALNPQNGTLAIITPHMVRGDLEHVASRLYARRPSDEVGAKGRLALAYQSAQCMAAMHARKEMDPDFKCKNLFVSHTSANVPFLLHGDKGGCQKVMFDYMGGVISLDSKNCAFTYGYLDCDPRLRATGLMKYKNNVFSLGVVLFTLLTGHPPVQAYVQEKELVHWWTGHKERVEVEKQDWPIGHAIRKGADWIFGERYQPAGWGEKEAKKLAQLIASLISKDVDSRPTACQVMSELLHIMDECDPSILTDLVPRPPQWRAALGLGTQKVGLSRAVQGKAPSVLRVRPECVEEQNVRAGPVDAKGGPELSPRLETPSTPTITPPPNSPPVEARKGSGASGSSVFTKVSEECSGQRGRSLPGSPKAGVQN